MTSRARSSKKSRPSRKPSSSHLPFWLTHNDVREAIEPILGDVLAAAARIGERADPFAAELFAAGLRAALCAGWRVVVDDGDSALGIALARAAEDAGGPGAVALLRAVEATWPHPAASRARSGTQLTDVEQERNGLLTFERRPKVDPALIRPITRMAKRRAAG